MTRAAILAVLALAAALAGCGQRTQQPESSAAAGTGYKVDKLFTHDGCTVYRFWDWSNTRYFVRCDTGQAETMTSQSCGKGCTSSTQIPTVRAKER